MRQALELRTALLSLFGEAPLSAGARAVMSGAGADTWQLVLEVECAGLALAEPFGRHGGSALLAPSASSIVSGQQTIEAQRVLTARAVIQELDSLATRLGIRVVVLKGSVPIAENSAHQVDLGDVDILVSPEDSRRLWQALLQAGWMPKIEELHPRHDRVLSVNHFAPLVAPLHGFQLEIHENLWYDDDENHALRIGYRPIRGTSSLDRPIGAAYVWTLLLHSVAHHPMRRGHLRDLWLIAGEMRGLSTADIAAVRADAAAHPLAAELLAMLDACIAVGERQVPEDADTLRPHVAMKYLTTLGYGGQYAQIPEWAYLFSAALERSPVRRRFYLKRLAEMLEPVPEGSTFGHIKSAMRFPIVAEGIVRVVRAAHRLATVALLISFGWLARRHVRRAVAG